MVPKCVESIFSDIHPKVKHKFKQSLSIKGTRNTNDQFYRQNVGLTSFPSFTAAVDDNTGFCNFPFPCSLEKHQVFHLQYLEHRSEGMHLP